VMMMMNSVGRAPVCDIPLSSYWSLLSHSYQRCSGYSQTMRDLIIKDQSMFYNNDKKMLDCIKDCILR